MLCGGGWRACFVTRMLGGVSGENPVEISTGTVVKIYLMLSDITRRGIRKYLLILGDSLDTYILVTRPASTFASPPLPPLHPLKQTKPQTSKQKKPHPGTHEHKLQYQCTRNISTVHPPQTIPTAPPSHTNQNHLYERKHTSTLAKPPHLTPPFCNSTALAVIND